MSKLTYHQLRALEIVNEGGKIFHFDDGSVGLDSVDGDSYKFRYSTFAKLNRIKAIDIVERPAIGVRIYGLTYIGKSLLTTLLA